MGKPNLLIIQTDQQSSWTLGAYGGTLIDTPNIDFLAKEGVRFDNFFTPSAVCTPSRGCFITGRYPHCHGAYRNNVPINQDEVSLAHILKQHGYETGYAGKWHLDGADSPGWIQPDRAMGFDDCRYMFNSGHYKEAIDQEVGNPTLTRNIGDENTYMTDWLTNKTIDFISKANKQPFFFMMSIPDPHQPFKVRAPYDTMYKLEDMPIPASFYQEELPDWAEQDEWGRKRYFPLHQVNREERLKQIKSQYCGEVKCIDDNVGRIIKCLHDHGIFDDTIVVFTTDHGEYMGEHGLLEKNNLYETAYRIPLIIRWPEKIRQGLTINEFVSVVDFQQTILSLMGLKPCGREQGRDASPLLIGENVLWENKVFIHPSDVPRTGIITTEYELAYVGKGWNEELKQDFEDHILFDRINDPNQINNLFKAPEYRHIIDDLTKKIVKHHKKLGTNLEFLPAIISEIFNQKY